MCSYTAPGDSVSSSKLGAQIIFETLKSDSSFSSVGSDANIPAILGFPGIGISRKAFMSTVGFPREQIQIKLLHILSCKNLTTPYNTPLV